VPQIERRFTAHGGRGFYSWRSHGVCAWGRIIGAKAAPVSRNRRKYAHAPAAAPRYPSKPSAASQACCVAISWVHGRISAAARASRA